MVGTLTASQGNKKFSAKRSLDPEAYHYLSRKKRIESSEENHAEALPVKKADGSVVFRKQIVKTIDEEHKKTLVGKYCYTKCNPTRCIMSLHLWFLQITIVKERRAVQNMVKDQKFQVELVIWPLRNMIRLINFNSDEFNF